MIKDILEELKQNVDEFKMIKTEELIFSPEVRKSCEMNQCGCYGKTWNCPPAVGTVSSLQRKCLDFDMIMLISLVYPLDDMFDIEGMTAARKKTNELLQEIKKRAEGDNILILGVGSCDICVECSYPLKECRHPDKVIISLEAMGIDVVNTTRRAGIKYNNGPNTVTYFSGILFNPGDTDV